MIAIPCVLYFDGNQKQVQEIVKSLDRGDTACRFGLMLPNLDQKPYEVGSYNTPWGDISYDVTIQLKYLDRKAADPDTPAGKYHNIVKAKNSLEATELALDEFHENHPIDNLDNAEITTRVKRSK